MKGFDFKPLIVTDFKPSVKADRCSIIMNHKECILLRCIPIVTELVKASEAGLNCCDIFPASLLPVKLEKNQGIGTSLCIDVLTLVINWSKWISLSINSNKHICSLFKKISLTFCFLLVPGIWKMLRFLFKNHDDCGVCSTLFLICWQSEIWNTVFAYFMFGSQWIELYKVGHGQITKTRTSRVPNSLI
jgi:hypothetical protein